MNKLLTKTKLFQPEQTDDLAKRRIFHGSTTNLSNSTRVKYEWAERYREQMKTQDWHQSQLDLTAERRCFKTMLTDEERHAYKGFLSSLTFLDNIQTNNLPRLADYVTDPNVKNTFIKQADQEVLHSVCYSSCFENVFPTQEERDDCFYMVINNNSLKKRAEYISDLYQEFHDNPNRDSLTKLMIANYILEMFYFYRGFMYFYSLQGRLPKGLMVGTGEMINAINKDEIVHGEFFIDLIRTCHNEGSIHVTPELVHEMFDEAYRYDIEFSNDILGNNIYDNSMDQSVQFEKFLANHRIAQLCNNEIIIPPLFNDVIYENPYVHLQKYMAEELTNKAGNFFENNMNYNRHSLDFKDFETTQYNRY